jgi:hypothetical protein
MADNYVPDIRILEACPSCRSGHLICVLGIDLDMCLDCHRAWERLRPEDAYTIDGEMMAFKTPCDNCAFRGDSPERKDKEGWTHLQAMLNGGGEFYCHKGVPLKWVLSGLTVPDGDFGFDFPRKEAKVDIAGESHPYLHYDKARMRLCRGFLNAHIARLLKGQEHEQTLDY